MVCKFMLSPKFVCRDPNAQCDGLRRWSLWEVTKSIKPGGIKSAVYEPPSPRYFVIGASTPSILREAGAAVRQPRGAEEGQEGARSPG